MEGPSSDWRESMTLSSKLPQAGHRIAATLLRCSHLLGARGTPQEGTTTRSPAWIDADPLAAIKRSTSARTSPVGWIRRAMDHMVSPARTTTVGLPAGAGAAWAAGGAGAN